MNPSPSFCIASPDRRIVPAIAAAIDAKTKPLGALGRLEALALQVGLVQQTLSPALKRPVMLVFAADHGVAAEGVSLFPAEVTFQMVLNFLAGGAAINVFARQNGMLLRVIDAGVNGDLPRHADLIDAKIGYGTRSFLRGAAMTEAQCTAALARGGELARLEAEAGSNVMGFGEMGIGNTSSAAALMSALCGLSPELTVGRGTGLDEAGVARKREVIEQALQLHRLTPEEPLRALAAVGGFEIAMMAGAMLGAAQSGCLLLIDGFIAGSALLVASRLQPAILDYCIFAHRSNETAHARLLEHLGATPLLDLGLRLGEGTGAALAYPLVQAACGFLNEMASFAAAGVSGSSAA